MKLSHIHTAIQVFNNSKCAPATKIEIISLAEANGFDISEMEDLPLYEVSEKAFDYLCENAIPTDVHYDEYDGRGNASYGDFVISGEGLDGTLQVINDGGSVYFANFIK